MEQIEVFIMNGKKAREINSVNAGREFIISEIELGAGKNRKSVHYSQGFLQPHTQCKAVILTNRQIRII